MAKTQVIAVTDFTEIAPRVSEWRRFQRVFFSRGMVVFGLLVLLLLVFTAIFAGWLAPFNPYKISPGESLLQPGTKHLLGTDLLGRDTLSRLIYGSRTALMVGFISVGAASLIGIPLGIIAGYSGGFANAIIMRAMDTLMCFPMILLALVIAAVLGNGIWNVIIALSFATIPVRPGDARRDAEHPGERLHPGAIGDGFQLRAHNGEAYPAERPPAAYRAHDHAAWQSYPGGGRPELSRHRHRAARGCLGCHGQRWLPIPGEEPGALLCPGSSHYVSGLRI